jgi:methyl-accepting chemotaxis protein
MTLIKKLVAAFVVIVTLVVISTLISLTQMQNIQQAVALNDHSFKVIKTATTLAEDLLNIETGARGYIITSSEDFLQPYHTGKQGAAEDVRSITQLTSDNPDQQALIKKVAQQLVNWQQFIDEVVSQTRAAAGDQAKVNEVLALVRSGKGKLMMDGIRADLERFVIAEQALFTERTASVASARTMAFTSLLLGGLAVLVVSVVMAIYLKNTLQHRLNTAKNLVSAVASGRLNNRIDSSGGDEISELLAGIDVMQDQLRQLLGDIKQASGELGSASAVVAATAEQLNASANEQSRASSSIAAAVEELSVSINHVSGSSAEARQIASDSGRQAEQSSQVISNTVSSMERIAQVVRSASNRIEELGKQSEQISSIVSVIKGIADQTNLLALNAAIEAARAGEQGRGFAVVADEVRMLAQRTTQSTSEISTMIGLILSGTSDAVGQMGSGVTQVNQGVELAAQAGTAITEIQRSFQQVLTVIEQISLNLSEQNAASQEVAGHIERIATMSAQNTEATSHSSKVAHDLKTLSGQLNQAVARFTL